MSRNSKIIFGIVVILAVILGVWAVASSRSQSGSSTVTGDAAPQGSQTQSAVTSDTTGSAPSSPKVNTFTLADIAPHKSRSDCWTAIEGKVYNITPFIPKHPAGNVILRACGIDGTNLFGEMTPRTQEQADAILQQYYIGNLKQS